MYEFSLKQDLENIFGVEQDKIERLSLGGIDRYFKDNKIEANASFFLHLQNTIQQRNSMAHGFLVTNSLMASIVGEAASNRAARTLAKAIYELENTWHYYVIAKENDLLYKPNQEKDSQL